MKQRFEGKGKYVKTFAPRKIEHVIAMGDLHSGSVYGLAGPKYWTPGSKHCSRMDARWCAFQKILAERKKVAPIDVLIVNGDCIEGKGLRNGGNELIVSDRRVQAEIAAGCIDEVGAKKILMTRGTPYHTGVEEDWENIVAEMVKAEAIKDHLFAEIGGLIFSVKHKVGSSTVPHGRQTSISREKTWDLIWAAEKNQHPRSDVFLRSHVHYHTYAGKKGPDSWLAMTLPALQGLGCTYGSRQCSGTVDWGLVWFLIGDGRIIDWDAEIVVFEEEKDKIVRV